jgi:hypothetical protein
LGECKYIRTSSSNQSANKQTTGVGSFLRNWQSLS